MPLQKNQPAPDFMTADIFGKPVAISAFKGKKILLTFYRHVGCPVNNLRFQELRQYDTYFKEQDLVVLAVYESSVENLTRYCRDESFYARLIANPEFNLYTQYEIEQSTLKMLYSMYKGVFAKSLEGRKHFKDQFEPEGHQNLLGGDFLIGEDGHLKHIYYNQYLGDHMPTSKILKFAQSPE
jgi:peroxiredoxin Q/BCP